jgi:DNA-binding XRE family transcriptional regulator
MEAGCFSDLLREWRDCLNYTTVEAAEILDVTEATLLAWELRQETPEEIKLLAVTKLIRGDFIEMPCSYPPPEGWNLPLPMNIHFVD